MPVASKPLGALPHQLYKFFAAMPRPLPLLVCTGDGWSPRLEDAVLHGCIPVIIMDDVQVGVWPGVLGGGAPRLHPRHHHGRRAGGCVGRCVRGRCCTAASPSSSWTTCRWVGLHRLSAARW